MMCNCYAKNYDLVIINFVQVKLFREFKNRKEMDIFVVKLIIWKKIPTQF